MMRGCTLVVVAKIGEIMLALMATIGEMVPALLTIIGEIVYIKATLQKIVWTKSGKVTNDYRHLF